MRIKSLAIALTAFSLVLPAFGQSLNGSAPAATVNGEIITVDDWIARLQNLRYVDFVASINPLRPKLVTAGQIALEGLVNTKLVMQYAKKVSLMPSEVEVDAAVAEAKQQPNVQQAVKNKTLSEADLREDMRRQRTLFNVATINRNVTPEEVARYYAAHPDKYGQREEWRIAVIRMSTKANADVVAAELKAGKSFEDVANRLSEDPDTKKKGGELGTFATSDPTIPAFIKEAVAKLKVGETTPLISSNLGGANTVYFFLRLLDKKERVLIPLEQIWPQVERAALFEKVGGGLQKLEEIKKDAIIVVNLPGYQELFKKANQ